MQRQLSLFHPSGKFRLGENVFGKDVANVGLFRALINYGEFDRLHIVSNGAFRTSDLPSPAKPLRLTAGAIDNLAPVAETGTMLRGQPDLADAAWERRRLGGDHLWSMAGLIHSLGPPAMRAQLTACTIAPVQPWDALICTSPAVAETVARLFDAWEAHLASHVGAVRHSRPQLPVIPLGVDVGALPPRWRAGRAERD